MTITIIAEEIEPWLKYIWGQFAEINLLHTEYRLTTYNNTVSGSLRGPDYLIEYGKKQRYSNSLFIPSQKVFTTDDYTWLRDDLPVYRETIAANGDYDILYNAFVHLSRLEEWESESCGKLVLSYSSLHPRKEKRIWRIPVVNYLFNELEKIINERFPQIQFGSGVKPTIEFSHDVDYLEKTVQLRLKQSAFNLFNASKYLLKGHVRGSLSKFRKSIGFAVRKSDYWCFDYWDKLENEFNIKSVYYFFAKSLAGNKYNLKRWLIDPSYDITNNDRLKEKCKDLIDGGNKIGLHGSYYSALYEELFIKEKEVLEKAVDCPITRTRQHWLNYREDMTPYIHERADISEDSTLGFSDIAGFRAGVASKYAPYDHGEQRPFPFRVIPLVLMDSHIYDYSEYKGISRLNWIFNNMNRIKKFVVSIDWHQRAASEDYCWNKAYESIIVHISHVRTSMT